MPQGQKRLSRSAAEMPPSTSSRLYPLELLAVVPRATPRSRCRAFSLFVSSSEVPEAGWSCLRTTLGGMDTTWLSKDVRIPCLVGTLKPLRHVCLGVLFHVDIEGGELRMMSTPSEQHCVNTYKRLTAPRRPHPHAMATFFFTLYFLHISRPKHRR